MSSSSVDVNDLIFWSLSSNLAVKGLVGYVAEMGLQQSQPMRLAASMYVYNAVLLSGPPGTGKDTITAALYESDKRIVSFRKHRAGGGGQANGSYLDIDVQQFNHMQKEGGFLQAHERYNRYYGVSRAELAQNLAKGLVSVIHVGRHENLLALRAQPDLRLALSVLLLCSHDDAKKRLESRHNGREIEVRQRLTAFDEEQQILRNEYLAKGFFDFDLVQDTTNRTPAELAASIRNALVEGNILASEKLSEKLIQSLLL